MAEIVKNFNELSAEDKSVYLMIQEDRKVTENLAQYIIDLTHHREQLR